VPLESVPLESLFPPQQPYTPGDPFPGDPFANEPLPGEPLTSEPLPGELPAGGAVAGESGPQAYSPYEAAPSYQTEYPYTMPPAYEPDTSFEIPAQPVSPATYEPVSPATYEPAAPAPVPDQAGYGGQPDYQQQPVHDPEPGYQAAPDDGREPHVSIILSCHNFQDHVVREIERISLAMDASGLPYELVAIDDASTDATQPRLRSAEPYFPRLRVVHFPRHGGAGTVRRIGTQQARGEIVVWTDADMSYPNDRIPELVAMLDADPAVDQVVGARAAELGKNKVARGPARWFLRALAEHLTNSEIPDLDSGLRAFRKSVAQPYLRLLPPGSSSGSTITLAFLSNEHGVRYLPVDCAQGSGTPKFHPSGAYEYLLQVLRMAMYFSPLKVLMPPAIILICLGLLKGVADLVVHPLRFGNGTVLVFLTGLIIAAMALLADLIVRSRGDT
jgi:hypothetical protein